MNRNANGTGVGRLSAHGEWADRERILEAWPDRIKRAKGKVPGTRTLGIEFSRTYKAATL